MLIIKIAKWEYKKVMQLITLVKNKLSTITDLPDETLVCNYRGHGQIYYYSAKRINGKQKRTYIGGVESQKVKRFKIRRFLQDTYKALVKDKAILECLLNGYMDYSPEAIHRSLPSSYKNLPNECYTDQRFEELKEWASEKYQRNTFPLPADPNIARDGTPMRSKGECMWYDNILFENIPVRVDPKLEMKGKSNQWHTLCPDFLFMCYDGSYIAVEHFGKWDDDEYAMRNARRIQEYLDCGFVLGDNLIATSDNAEHNTNELMILEALEKIKKRLYGE